jgi:hypothetical protein
VNNGEMTNARMHRFFRSEGVPEAEFVIFLKTLIINSSKIVRTGSELIRTSSELISTSSELNRTSSEQIFSTSRSVAKKAEKNRFSV